MKQRVASSHLWPGKQVVSRWPGLGIPGSEIPTTGDSGGSPLANDGINADDEYRLELLTPPSAGTLTFFPDTSLNFVGPDGAYTFTYEGFENGVSYGSIEDPLNIGTVADAAIAATIGDLVFAGASFSSPVAAITAALAPLVFSGSSYASPVAAITATLGDLAFVGDAYTSGLSEATISATLGDLVFSGSSETVGPAIATILATLDPIVFVGAAFVSPSAAIAATVGSLEFAGSSYGEVNTTDAPNGSGPAIIIPRGTRGAVQNTTRPPNIGGIRI